MISKKRIKIHRSLSIALIFALVFCPFLGQMSARLMPYYNLKSEIQGKDQDSEIIDVKSSIAGYRADQITKDVGAEPYSVCIGDANNDGQNDIVAANSAHDNVSILLWNTVIGDWDAQIPKKVGNNPYSVCIGDANNDGQNDIVTANIGHDNVSILLWNTTAGDWDTQLTKNVGNGPYSVSIGDANNDG